MTCDEVVELLVAMSDGELSRSQGVLADEHLARCAECQALRLALDAATPQPFLDPPHHVQAELQRRVNIDTIWSKSLTDAPRARRASLAQWLGTPAELSRGAMVAYAALLLATLSWGAASWFVPASPTGAPPSPAARVEIPADHYQPASYQPEEDAVFP